MKLSILFSVLFLQSGICSLAIYASDLVSSLLDGSNPAISIKAAQKEDKFLKNNFPIKTLTVLLNS